MDIQDFIDKQELCFTYEDFYSAVDDFYNEMERGLEGKSSSLKMIPSYVKDSCGQVSNRRVIAIDMGGTNMRIALVYFNESGIPNIEEAKRYAMPGKDRPLEIDEFFDIVAKYLKPFLEKSNEIGLCFSFPCEIQPDLDGKILYFNKEVQINGASGQSIKTNLSAALEHNNIDSDISLAVINDTIAASLGAQALASDRSFSAFIGFILGTGSNTCYAEKNSLISKNNFLKDRSGKSFVNLESGGYERFKRAPIDVKFDQTTVSPGQQLFEKLVSGEYIGGLILNYLREAAFENCFLSGSGLLDLPSLSGYEIDKFLDNPYGDNILAKLAETEADKLSVWKIIDAIYDRGALYTAVTLAAILKKTSSASNPLKPVCISAEGSTFRKSRLLNQKTTHYMYEYAYKRLGLNYEFVYLENTTIFGSAYAALSGKRSLRPLRHRIFSPQEL